MEIQLFFSHLFSFIQTRKVLSYFKFVYFQMSSKQDATQVQLKLRHISPLVCRIINKENKNQAFQFNKIYLQAKYDIFRFVATPPNQPILTKCVKWILAATVLTYQQSQTSSFKNIDHYNCRNLSVPWLLLLVVQSYICSQLPVIKRSFKLLLSFANSTKRKTLT